jgi:succinoglycan biosynthesis protein ExoL
MTVVAFFGHDVGDAAVRRRVQTFTDDGVGVIGFMMKRRADVAADWPFVDLGMTRDGAFLHRIAQIFSGARRAAAARESLAKADVIYARNLDMLACAFLTKRLLRSKTPVVYECLDVHRLLSRKDFVGASLRRVERWLLKRSAALVVSSPAFIRHHFEVYYPGIYRHHLVENRMADGADYGPRPTRLPTLKPAAPLRIGWVGVLRCQRSLDLLCAAADALGAQVEIHLYGVPARNEIPIFEPVIAARTNIIYHGRYKSPEDLARIYGNLDVVWAGDFMEAGFHSVWLLPNRLYEGGYFGVPAIAPEGTETAAWISARQCGFEVSEPIGETLARLLQALATDRSPVAAARTALLNSPETAFKQPKGLMQAIVKTAMVPKGAK